MSENESASAATSDEQSSTLPGKGDDSKSSGATLSNSSRVNHHGDPTFQLGAQETRIVRRSKLCVYCFLLLTAVVGSIATWQYLVEVEQKSFEQQFNVFAEGILAVSTINALSTFALFDAKALEFTTNALRTGQEWPFFTLTMFEHEVSLLYNQTQVAGYIAIHPLVTEDQRLEWENYTNTNQGWVQDAYDFYGLTEKPPPICPVISQSFSNCTPAGKSSTGLYAPAWQLFPAPELQGFINFDGFFFDGFPSSFDKLQEKRHVMIGDSLKLLGDDDPLLSFLMTPIYKDMQPNASIVAVLVGVIFWDGYFINLLPEGEKGIEVVISNEETVLTFEIDGPQVYFVGSGDLHDEKYNDLLQSNEFAGSSNGTSGLGFTVSVYPTQEFEETHTTNDPMVYTLAVAFVFLFAISVFFAYDFFVERRQTKVMLTATKSSAIVNSLFPANVRDRLMEEQNSNDKARKNFAIFDGSHRENGSQDSKPIADLFPDATVMFADIAGFTAWSSSREPSQVFVLLESLYNSFDKIAKRMKVFKVETIGDSYVAVAGLPEPQKDHAELMARFAHKCLVKMNALAHDLETVLGPGTSELKMRVGLHSGSVTAGVLGGEKSRFQLFGDTVNTAARMESTGIKDRIHLSKETADLLIASGKEHWVKPRANKVFAKGKGELQTFWFAAQGTDSDTAESATEGTSATSLIDGDIVGTTSHSVPLERKSGRNSIERLILWNVENLCFPLKKIIASRQGRKLPSLDSWRKLSVKPISPNNIFLDEVEDIITLPEHCIADIDNEVVDAIVLDKVVLDQLTDYVATIASMYRNNAFHNFEHASHVAQSVTKLLSRVVTSDQFHNTCLTYDSSQEALGKLHDYTFGITSSPWIHFAVIFLALIHDVDHPGVPNATLVKEGHEMAIVYGNKSVAEQNSLDIAWGLLMEPKYEDLRRTIYTTQAELEIFRKLLVHAVLATDVMDKELGNLRKKRWDQAFQSNADNGMSLGDSCSVMNRKATVVVEYLIQASDVAHTMQHWHIYTHWNEKFFHECHKAFIDGRSETDPTDGWYDGELAFFDYYVIPLAKRLKDCGVFGVSSDEYLNYATSNRDEWSRRGKEMIEFFVANLDQK